MGRNSASQNGGVPAYLHVDRAGRVHGPGKALENALVNSCSRLRLDGESLRP